MLKNKSTRVLIIIMSTLFILAFVAGQIYFDYDNKSVDPRTLEVVSLYEEYNIAVANSNYERIFTIMDSIEDVYKSIPHFQNSYEMGVVFNNRAATYISLAIKTPDADTLIKDSLLNLAYLNSVRSIEIYSEWINDWENKDKEEIIELIKPHYHEDNPVFAGKKIERFINKRTKQIIEAQKETPRRLSVSHTNLGIIYRHQNRFEDALLEYFTALELWPDNMTAENNMNILMDKPLKKPSILRRIFPKDRFD
jgi:tetratricopeptide (TPR) repeat protein